MEMSFTYKPRKKEFNGEVQRKSENGFRNSIGADIRAQRYISFLEIQNKKGISLRCRKCENYIKCPDKLAVILKSQDSINTLLKAQKDNPVRRCRILYKYLLYLGGQYF